MSTNEFIRRLERDLGQTTDRAMTPRELPTLPGTAADACLLPSFESERDFFVRYGSHYSSGGSQATIEALQGMLADGAKMLDSFETFARDHVGDEVLDVAEATLRAFGRLEQALKPLFAGLPMATYGLVRAACIRARARVGDILDQKTLANEL